MPLNGEICFAAPAPQKNIPASATFLTFLVPLLNAEVFLDAPSKPSFMLICVMVWIRQIALSPGMVLVSRLISIGLEIFYTGNLLLPYIFPLGTEKAKSRTILLCAPLVSLLVLAPVDWAIPVSTMNASALFEGAPPVNKATAFPFPPLVGLLEGTQESIPVLHENPPLPLNINISTSLVVAEPLFLGARECARGP